MSHPEDPDLIQSSGGVTIVRFEEPHIDTENYDSIRRQLMTYLDIYQPKQVLANLWHIEYLHSIGIGLLTGMLKHVQAYGGHFALCSLQSDVSDLLKVTHMQNMFSIFANEKEALDHFAKHPQ